VTLSKLIWFLLAVAVSAAFAGLGNWQWQRALLKEGLEDRLATASSDAPVALSTALTSGAAIRYTKVTVDGVLQAPSVFLDNQIRDGRVGVLVVNRLRIEAAEADLLVIRGWVPLSDGIRGLPEVDLPGAELTLNGFVDQPPAAGLSLGVPPGSSDEVDPLLVTRIDLDWLEQRWQTPLLPWVLYLAPAAPAGYLRDWQPKYLPPQRHRGYAVQWWGLAAATLVIYAVLSWRQHRRKETKSVVTHR